MIITNKPVDCREFADLLKSKAKWVRHNDEGVARLASHLDIMHGETVVRAVMLVGKGREDA